MALKITIALLMFGVLFSLGSGLFFLLKDAGSTSRTVKALTWRISLSFCLLLLLIVSYALGWIHPHPAF